MKILFDADILMENAANRVQLETIERIIPNNPYFVEHSIYFAESLTVFADAQRTKRLTLGLDYEYAALDSIASEQSNQNCYRALLFLKSFDRVYLDYHSYGDLITADLFNTAFQTISETDEKTKALTSKVTALAAAVTEHTRNTKPHSASESVAPETLVLRTSRGTIKAHDAQEDSELTAFGQTKAVITKAKDELHNTIKQTKDDLIEIINTKIRDLIDNAPEDLDTLKELATALNTNKDGITAINAALTNRYTKQESDTHDARTLEKAKQYADTKVPQAGQGDSSDVDQNKGLGLTKTVNRAPNMQECQKNEPWAASPNWVFKLLLGESQEDVKDQISKSLQKRVKEDNAIFCYRGIVPAADINAVTKSGIYSVDYSGSSGCLLVFTPYGSAGVIQFYKAGYSGNIPWKYRNAVDSDTKRWTAWKTFLCQDNFKLSGTTLEITL